MEEDQIRILVIEDEKPIADILEYGFKKEQFMVKSAYTGADGLKAADDLAPHLVILDWMLPDLSGVDVCRMLTELYNIPIIMLTAKGEETDKITGLTLGADDYMTKPFLPLELIARIKAQLRRYKKYNVQSGSEEQILTHSGLVLNVDTHECFLNEKPLDLTPTEFSILSILCRRKGTVVSSEELFHEIWGEKYFSKSNNTITVHIRHLREKMGDSFEHPNYIKTVWGCGYKIEK